MRHDIVNTAKSWIGTRFHHQGRLKKTDNHKGGVDCLGLLIGVAQELNLPFYEYDETNYSHYPDTQKLRENLAKYLQEPHKNNIEIGDILLLSIDGNPQHLAIVSEINGAKSIIHAYAPAHAVVEHILDNWWQERVVAVFRIK